MIGLAVILGLVVGSFLNVVIARLPAHRSLWRPGSACPTCGAAIAWHDNIPLLSFLLLRGRCRACGAPISWRYPLVEFLTGGLFGLAWLVFGATRDALIAIALLATLIAITFIDLRHQIIPDVITLPGVVAGLLANLTTGRVPWVESVLGIVAGGGAFLVIILASGGGMGGGDMKLGAMLGAFLGWKVTLLSLFLAVVLGGILAIALLASGRSGRKDPIPFGPFLAVGGTVGLFWGERLVAWYLSGFAG
ncbi:MAG: prepilin peptidase [Candidatus Rokubacteria bacterium]|nr:prepilin peptidase [Candidatus Rokubacteria bacterium]